MDTWLYGHEDRDRERGILSPADREFLTSGGENLNSESARQNARYRIRQRIRNAIIDFDLIIRLFSEEDQLRIFEEGGEWEPAFLSGQKSMIEFLYSNLDDADIPVDFETILKSGVHDGELQHRDQPTSVDIDFDVETTVEFDIDAAYRRFKAGEQLTISEIGALLASDKIDDDELDDLAEHSKKHGVFESSISPLQANYVRRELDINAPEDDTIKLPANDAYQGGLREYFSRGETIMLTDAYMEDDALGMWGDSPDDEEADAANDESEEDTDG